MIRTNTFSVIALMLVTSHLSCWGSTNDRRPTVPATYQMTKSESLTAGDLNAQDSAAAQSYSKGTGTLPRDYSVHPATSITAYTLDPQTLATLKSANTNAPKASFSIKKPVTYLAIAAILAVVTKISLDYWRKHKNKKAVDSKKDDATNLAH